MQIWEFKSDERYIFQHAKRQAINLLLTPDISMSYTMVYNVVHYSHIPWWRHQMKAFSALLALCANNSPVTAEFPAQRPVTRSFDILFDLRLNKWLSKTIVRLVTWDAFAPIMTSL